MIVGSGSGNFSDGTNWVGGVAPAGGDDFDVNGFDMTMAGETFASGTNSSIGSGSLIVGSNMTLTGNLSYITVALNFGVNATLTGNTTGVNVTGTSIAWTVSNGNVTAGNFPNPGDVLLGQTSGNQPGSLVLPDPSVVAAGTVYGQFGTGSTGTAPAGGSVLCVGGGTSGGIVQ